MELPLSNQFSEFVWSAVHETWHQRLHVRKTYDRPFNVFFFLVNAFILISLLLE